MAEVIASSGLEALESASTILPDLRRIDIVSHGGIEGTQRYCIEKCTFFPNQGLFVLGASGALAVYLRDGNLCSNNKVTFTRDLLFLNPLFREIYQRTRGGIPALNITFAIVGGVVAGFFVVGAVVGTIAVIVGKIALFSSRYPVQVGAALNAVPVLFELIIWLRSNCPTIYEKLFQGVGRGLLISIGEIPSGLRAEDAAKLLGSFFGKALKSPRNPTVLFAPIIVTLVASIGSWAATTLPAAGVRGTVSAAEGFISSVRNQGISITTEEAGSIVQEISNNGQAIDKLTTLRIALTDIETAISLFNEVFAEDVDFAPSPNNTSGTIRSGRPELPRHTNQLQFGTRSLMSPE